MRRRCSAPDTAVLLLLAVASAGVYADPNLDDIQERIRQVTRRVDALQRRLEERRRRTDRHPTRPQTVVTLYGSADCQGSQTRFDASRSENKCKACLDVCVAKFDDGKPCHGGSSSAVLSFKVTGPGVVRAYTGCHGTYDYSNPESSLLIAATAEDGCVSDEVSPDHFAIYAQEEHDRRFPGGPKIAAGAVPDGLAHVSWQHPGGDLGTAPGELVCGDADGSLAVHWKKVAADAAEMAEPPFPQGGYLSFEPDNGGWNNIRLGLEISVLLAAATGRTLVIPPSKPLYLLTNSQRHKHNPVTSFYDVDALVSGAGLPKVVSAEGFLQAEVRSDRGLFREHSGSVPASGTEDPNAWFQWMRKSADWSMKWVAEQHVIVFPESNTAPPLADDAPGSRRAARVGGARTLADVRLLAKHRWVHMPVEKFSEQRYLAQFYAFLVFLNETHERRYNRFARDAMRYKPKILCKAAKIIERLQAEGGGTYSSAHIRRGEFQQKPAWLSAEQILDNTKDVFKPGCVLYVSTDQKDKKWFGPLRDRYRLRFFTDFSDSAGLDALEPGEVGMVEQVVASAGDVFVGTWWSTFTAYIMRLRCDEGLIQVLGGTSRVPRARQGVLLCDERIQARDAERRPEAAPQAAWVVA
eukprot:TRINITY_DN2682_c0_g1_i2.p1 TRINITY_DN2682_c0_g1~~TRINITY_DN2682_c0_g1_i2.p1  ORF type:complete len:637 (+),score=179.53 TRINITY_DN2682_c0_g1_i2:82-1992(+)